MSEKFAAPDGDRATLLFIKAVPGAKRDEIVGLLGDRLKIRISAPPEGGRANKAICELIAKQLGIRKQDVQLMSGQSDALKTIRIHNITPDQLPAHWHTNP